MELRVDFTKTVGQVKPMHGIGQPPMYGHSQTMYHYLKDAGIPYSRLHDVGGWMGGGLYVDVPNLFRNFDADENDPASYDFEFTDWIIERLMEQKCEPFFRLGVTIENAHMLKAYRIFPPKDFRKWARICEHIIRHYREGWANGYHFDITYWEIWNEPDDCWKIEASPMWKGTKEQYFELYEITANHLKACFGDSIKVGGYASCGFYAMNTDPKCDGSGICGSEAKTREEFFLLFFKEFLQYISSEEHKAPLDFFSWHTYADVKTALRHADYCRAMLNSYGFSEVEDILNEWNTTPDRQKRSTAMAAARVLAMMLGMQKKSPSILCFYDGRIGPSEYGGLFNPDTWKPYPAYYSLMAFNSAYKLKNEIETVSDCEDVYALGASDGEKSVLLISNLSGDEQRIKLSVNGASLARAEVIRIDDSHTYSLTGESIADGEIILSANSCAEIRFS